jgi:hypothetical protein
MALAACARGGMHEPALVDAGGDAPAADGPQQMIDAPSQSGTCTMTFTGTLAKWDMTGETGSQATSAVDMQAPGVTAGALSRAAGLTAVSGANSINSSGWPTAAQMDATKYYAFTLAPPAGCELSILQVTLDARASGTGPAMAALATSADAYATSKPVATGQAVVVMPMVSASAMIELRVYGWAATSSGGTLRVQNALTVDGELR